MHLHETVRLLMTFELEELNDHAELPEEIVQISLFLIFTLQGQLEHDSLGVSNYSVQHSELCETLGDIPAVIDGGAVVFDLLVFKDDLFLLLGLIFSHSQVHDHVAAFEPLEQVYIVGVVDVLVDESLERLR